MGKKLTLQKAILLVLFIGLLSLVLSNCKKSCEQNQVVDLKFSQEDLKINSYSGNEVLIFKNLSGDSLAFNKGMRYHEPYIRYKIDYEEAKLYHNGCQGDYFNAEQNETIFWALAYDSTTKLSITLSFLYSFDNPTYKKSINLFFFHARDKSAFDASFEFRNGSLYNLAGKSDSIVTYHNQLTLGTKTFSGVYELYCPNGDPRNPEWFRIAYYSITEGYLGFLSNLGQLWYLEREVN